MAETDDTIFPPGFVERIEATPHRQRDFELFLYAYATSMEIRKDYPELDKEACDLIADERNLIVDACHMALRCSNSRDKWPSGASNFLMGDYFDSALNDSAELPILLPLHSWLAYCLLNDIDWIEPDFLKIGKNGLAIWSAFAITVFLVSSRMIYSDPKIPLTIANWAECGIKFTSEQSRSTLIKDVRVKYAAIKSGKNRSPELTEFAKAYNSFVSSWSDEEHAIGSTPFWRAFRSFCFPRWSANESINWSNEGNYTDYEIRFAEQRSNNNKLPIRIKSMQNKLSQARQKGLIA